MIDLNLLGKKVLIVDDSWVTRQLLKKMLQKTQCYLEEAADGEEALEKIIQSQPDCIIMDLLMPKLNGIDTFLALKKQKIKVPVVFLSADIQDSTRNKCMALGALGFVNKPAKEEEIFKLIARAIKQK